MDNNLFLEAANEQALNRVHSIVRVMLELEKKAAHRRSHAYHVDRNLAHFSWAQLQTADRSVREVDEELAHLTERRDALLQQVPLRDLMIACQRTVPPEDFFDEETSAIHDIYIEAVEARMAPALAFARGRPTISLQEVQAVLAPLMDEWFAFSQAPENQHVFGNYTPQRIAQLYARFQAALRALEDAHATAVLSATHRRLGADARLSTLPSDVLSHIATFSRP